MTDRLYLMPIGLAASPQSEEGDAIRLAGGLVYAHRFAAIVRRDGCVVERYRFTPETAAETFARLPDELGDDAENQWSALRTAHPPLQLGERTIRLDQPRIAGILNVTPDSFSDGGKFLDRPEDGAAHAARMLEAGAALVDIGG
jgi:dihydropteroate synthase